MDLLMNKDEILAYLTKQIDLLQRKAIELQEQHDYIEKQLRAYKQLVRMYQAVYESEAGVGLLNKPPAEIIEIVEKEFSDKGSLLQKEVKQKKVKKTKQREKS